MLGTGKETVVSLNAVLFSSKGECGWDTSLLQCYIQH